MSQKRKRKGNQKGIKILIVLFIFSALFTFYQVNKYNKKVAYQKELEEKRIQDSIQKADTKRSLDKMAGWF